MYLSCLLIDVGEDPDRPRPGRLWLRNLYHVHQRLCMAFPSASRKSEDTDFLKPYKPEDFAQGHVHTPRNADAGFLFRVDPKPGGRVVILVQSAMKPDWEYAFGLIKDAVDDHGRPIGNAGFLLAAGPEVKPFDPCFADGQSLRFRLVANPTRRLSKNSLHSSGEPVKKGIGKRVPVPTDKLEEWLSRWVEEWPTRQERKPPGFRVERLSSVQAGYIHVNKPWNGAPCARCGGQMREETKTEEIVCEQCKWRVRPLRDRLRSARYDGILKITDPAHFQGTLVQGIGPGKAFGFGLLSVARSGE